MRQGTLFEGQRLQMNEAVELTVASLLAYGRTHRRWAIAYSGGKDSTLLLILVVWLIRTGRVPPPEEITVLYADTRMELPPLAIAAAHVRAELEGVAEELADLGCTLRVRVVLPPIDDRFFVYILGRGVPPPSNTMRWCTEQLKVDPMEAELERLAGERRDKILMLTGLRLGESAARDDRIALACGKDGGECGQGWYQESLKSALVDTLAPILHWRVCHVWAYLRHHGPAQGFDTALIAEAYGGDEAEEENARTGCSGCPVAAEDHTLARICRMPEWAYLAPLKKLRTYYWGTLRSPLVRLRKRAGEVRKDGTPVKNQQRMGPITFEGRRAGLAFILGVQAEVNEAAQRLGRPTIDILNAEEAARIEALIAAETWPNKWDGDEPLATEMHDVVLPDGGLQPLLPWFKG
jgi:DNA sulfur modification protein DndC